MNPIPRWQAFHGDRPGAAQSVIRFGLPVPPPTSADYIPLSVTNALLGGPFASCITTNIREQKGYTYSPFSMIETHRHDAYRAELADVTTAVTGPALQEIVNEIARLRKDPRSGDELGGIENYMAGVFVISNSSRQGVIQQLRFVDLQGVGEQGQDRGPVQALRTLTAKRRTAGQTGSGACRRPPSFARTTEAAARGTRPSRKSHCG